MKKKSLILLLSLFVLSACSSTSTSADLPGSGWLLESMPGYADLGPLEVSLNFGEDGSVGGVGGCNNYGGSYSVSGENKITFSQLFSTEMYCEGNNASDIEAAYFDALSQSSSFTLNFETLRIESAMGELVFGLAP